MAAVIPLHPPAGASPTDWQHFDMLLELTEDLLPVVSNTKATISPHSTMKDLGKTPSVYNSARHAVGIAGWTQYRAGAADIAKWVKERDYGICLQTRRIRAIDIDVTDAQHAHEIYERIRAALGVPVPIRMRSNSAKCLVAFECPGELAKRKFKTTHGIVELLATGQQFIAVGTHPSGVRYEWVGGLPRSFPVLTLAQTDALWRALATEYAIEAPTESAASVKNQKLADVIAHDPIAQYLLDHWSIKKIERDQRMHIECPWVDDHSADSTSETATTYFPAHTGGYIHGHFECLHAHCTARKDQEFLDAIGFVPEALLTEFSAIAAPPSDIAPITEPVTQPSAPAGLDVKYPVISAMDFLKRPAPTWIVKGILPEAELGVLYGESGSGKSFLALDMLAAIGRGVPWRGRKVKQGRVVYIAAEGAGGARNRVHAYVLRHGLSDLPLGIIDAAPNLMEKADALELARSIVACGGADLVVIDTLAQVSPGANENSSEDMGRVLAHCKGIHRATGAMVLVIHHSGKDASRGARGWSGIKGALDVEMEVSRADNARSVSISKMKDGLDKQEFGFTLDTVVIGLDEDEEEITSCVVAHNDQGRPAKVIRRAEPKGVNERLVLRVLGDLMALSGEPVEANALLEGVVNQMVVEPGKRDRRRNLALQALESLRENLRVVFAQGRVGLPDV